MRHKYYEELAAAAILRGQKEYQKAKKLAKKYPRLKEPKETIAMYEEFLESEQFQVLSAIAGKTLLSKLQGKKVEGNKQRKSRQGK